MTDLDKMRIIGLAGQALTGLAAAYELGMNQEDPEALAAGTLRAMLHPVAELALIFKWERELKHIQFIDGKVERVQ